MVDRVNLADPDCEPTDAQLVELGARAFRGVRSAHEAALRRLRAEIARTRAEALLRLESPLQEPRDPT